MVLQTKRIKIAATILMRCKSGRVIVHYIYTSTITRSFLKIKLIIFMADRQLVGERSVQYDAI